jgi:hypothetical protein
MGRRTVLGVSAARLAHRRAALEEALLDAYAGCDGERWSRPRGEVVQLKEEGDS